MIEVVGMLKIFKRRWVRDNEARDHYVAMHMTSDHGREVVGTHSRTQRSLRFTWRSSSSRSSGPLFDSCARPGGD